LNLGLRFPKMAEGWAWRRMLSCKSCLASRRAWGRQAGKCHCAWHGECWAFVCTRASASAARSLEQRGIVRWRFNGRYSRVLLMYSEKRRNDRSARARDC